MHAIISNFSGPPGFRAESGESGMPGFDGLPGKPGRHGQKGAPGEYGRNGPDGIPGRAGPITPGPKGMSGNPGVIVELFCRNIHTFQRSQDDLKNVFTLIHGFKCYRHYDLFFVTIYDYNPHIEKELITNI